MATESKITENTYVRLGGVILVVVLLFGFVVRETTFRTNLIRDVQELRQEIAELTKVIKASDERVIPDRFRKADMRLWILETEKLNPTWKAAPLQ